MAHAIGKVTGFLLDACRPRPAPRRTRAV